MADPWAATKEFLEQQHLAPLLSQVNQSLCSLNKWDTVAKALKVGWLVLLHLRRVLLRAGAGVCRAQGLTLPPARSRQWCCARPHTHSGGVTSDAARHPCRLQPRLTHSFVPCATQSLGTTNVLSAPVLDEDGEYYGCLSVNDLLKGLYKGALRRVCVSRARVACFHEGLRVWRGCGVPCVCVCLRALPRRPVLPPPPPTHTHTPHENAHQNTPTRMCSAGREGPRVV
jgi:hypothetical protein